MNATEIQVSPFGELPGGTLQESLQNLADALTAAQQATGDEMYKAEQRLKDTLEECQRLAGANDAAMNYLLEHIQSMATQVGYNIPVFGSKATEEAPEVQELI